MKELLATAFGRANQFDRSETMLRTLVNTVMACDAIETGEAFELAQRLGPKDHPFKSRYTEIHSTTIEAYIRLRSDSEKGQDGKREWAGPRAATLRKSGPVYDYWTARRDSRREGRRPRPSNSAKRLREIVNNITPMEDQQELRFALEEAGKKAKQYELLKKAIEKHFPEDVLEAILFGNPSERAALSSDLSADEKKSLRSIRSRLVDNDQLKPIGLVYENKRLKSAALGAPLLNRQELETLLKVVDQASL
ncbi:hypothetical protein WJS89_09520 [Sphingomicrobium sp. XHP0235]|uniref:hypothetical protein n=1 Tax=Sphingomicrobium aquimarinum TaxID=3133971 RepID=UPI0031FEBBEE